MNTEITVGSRVSFAGFEWVVVGFGVTDGQLARITNGDVEFCWVYRSRLTLVEPKFWVEHLEGWACAWMVRQPRPGDVVATFTTEGEARAYCAAANAHGLPVTIVEDSATAGAWASPRRGGSA